MNRAVSSGDVHHFRLKIKTAFSNKYIASVDSQSSVSTCIANKEVSFIINNGNDQTKEIFKRLRPGQYFKAQLAYVSTEGMVGYFSTVATIKFTSKPEVSIIGLNNAATNGFKQTVVGKYEVTDDKTERPYSYMFNLYNNEKEVLETSGWQLHNTNINRTGNNSLQFDSTIDEYTFLTVPENMKDYYIQYVVKTINDLEISSPIYACKSAFNDEDVLPVELNADNIFEDGYIKLSFEDVSNNNYPNGSISIEFRRAIHDTNVWKVIKRVTFVDFDALLKWSFKDLAVEQGITYDYQAIQYNENLYAGTGAVKTVTADFEDMFLDGTDGKQLKIRFNPKVTSFKADIQEQKIETIGSKYPYFFRNGIVNYKEFPIAGLISYQMDENEEFMLSEDYGVNLNDLERTGTPQDQEQLPNNLKTTNLVDYNIKAERQFKLEVLNWLNNGEIKLFRSPTEGNYLVRLMNVSLSPEEKLGRMLHNFSATAYEIEDLTYERLLELGFLKTENETVTTVGIKSFRLLQKNKSSDLYKIPLTDMTKTNLVPPNIYTPYELNSDPIYGDLQISSANDNQGVDLVFRMGTTNPEDRVVINQSFNFHSDNDILPNLYFVIGDNLVLTGDEETDNAAIENLINKMTDCLITYTGLESTVPIGSFNNITNITFGNIIESMNGYYVNKVPGVVPLYNIIDTQGTATQEITTSQVYIIQLQRKQIIDLLKTGDNHYSYYDPYTKNQREIINVFMDSNLYRVYQNTTDENPQLYYSYQSSIENCIIPDESKIYKILAHTQDNLPVTFELMDNQMTLTIMYKDIEVPPGILLTCAKERMYTTKVVNTTTGE